MDNNNEPAPFLWIEEGKEPVYTPRTRKRNKKKKEFVGWGSRQLIEFLESIGEDTSKKLSQHEATGIITQYINKNKLLHPEKKKKVMCDEKLHALFGRKSVNRVKIYDLLEMHLAENQIDSDDDFFYSSEEKEEEASAVSKRQKGSGLDKKTQATKKAEVVSKNRLAAISPENIKLVYLKRTLVQELLKNSETFEGKVVGSFVRIKSDPLDITQKNSHQLQLVTGVKAVPAAGGDSSSTILQISGITNEIITSALSDDNFSEEECEDLRKRIKDGFIKQPTVGELEQKVGVLHEDITKHWLARELVLLKKLVDRANEKGWRHRVIEYLEKKRLLETPSEQSRLLSQIPEVKAEVKAEEKAETVADGPPDETPKVTEWDWEPCNDSAVKEVTTKVSSKQDGQAEVGTRTGKESNGDIQCLQTEEGALPKGEATRAESNGYMLSFDLKERHLPKLEPVRAVSTTMLSFDLKERHIPKLEAVRAVSNGHTNSLSQDHTQFLGTEETRENNNGQSQPLSSEVTVFNGTKDVQKKQMEVIDLSDDDEEQEVPCTRKQIPVPLPEPSMWYYLDPRGNVQGPFALSSLKRWRDANYFPPSFSVWRIGQRPEEAVLLSDVIRKTFPN